MPCPSWVNYPNSLKGTTGGFLGTNVIVCGGFEPPSDECHSITQTKANFLTKMIHKRYNAASLIIKEKYLWVSGGNNGSNTLSSSEHIEIMAAPGPDLPEALEGHKMIDITEDLTLFIGGFSQVVVESTTSTSFSTLESITSSFQMDSTAPEGCDAPNRYADGRCDWQNDNKACKYDGGDCITTVEGNK